MIDPISPGKSSDKLTPSDKYIILSNTNPDSFNSLI